MPCLASNPAYTACLAELACQTADMRMGADMQAGFDAQQRTPYLWLSASGGRNPSQIGCSNWANPMAAPADLAHSCPSYPVTHSAGKLPSSSCPYPLLLFVHIPDTMPSNMQSVP